MYIQFLTNESRVAYPFIFNTKKSFHLILIPSSVLEKSFLVKYLQSSLSSLLAGLDVIYQKSKRYSIWNVCLLYYLRICALRAFFIFFYFLGYLFIQVLITERGRKFIIFLSFIILISLGYNIYDSVAVNKTCWYLNFNIFCYNRIWIWWFWCKCYILTLRVTILLILLVLKELLMMFEILVDIYFDFFINTWTNVSIFF